MKVTIPHKISLLRVLKFIAFSELDELFIQSTEALNRCTERKISSLSFEVKRVKKQKTTERCFSSCSRRLEIENFTLKIVTTFGRFFLVFDRYNCT